MSPRNTVERLLRGYTVRRSMPKEFGHLPIFISADAGLRYVFRSMNRVDPELLSLAREFVMEASNVWDIGANVGLFTLAAAYCAGKSGQIVAVEADIMLAHLLQRSVMAQPEHIASIDVIPAAAAESAGIRKFAIAKRARANNHLAEYTGSTQTGGTRYSQSVAAITLDLMSHFYNPPSVLKIDVEGAELEVLKGGQSIIAQARPTIICEVTNQATAPEIGHLLRGLGYQMYDADLAPSVRVPLEQPAYNTLALPID